MWWQPFLLPNAPITGCGKLQVKGRSAQADVHHPPRCVRVHSVVNEFSELTFRSQTLNPAQVS